MRKTIIFDFDGTIANSFTALLEIFEELKPRQQKLTTEEIENLRGKSLNEILKYLKIKKWQIPHLAIKARKALSAKIVGIKPFRGLPDALNQMHKDGSKMYILSTNSSANISKFLKMNSLNFFEEIYGDIGLRSKSSALKKLIKKEKLESNGCVYIGDEVRDADAAHKIGISFVAVSWGFNLPEALKKTAPSALAKTPSDLPKLLKIL